MKKKILLFTAVCGISYLVFSSHSAGPGNVGYDCTGAETAGSGTFANPASCGLSGCHSSSATSTISVALELDSAGVATTHYRPGHTYTIKITGNNGSGSSLGTAGFQIACLDAAASAGTNADAGSFATTGLPASTHIAAPYPTYTQLHIAEHSAPIAVTGTTLTESFSWTAPATGSTTISIWGAVNFVNGNARADAGDLWNTTHITIPVWPSTLGVEAVAGSMGLLAYPNPANDYVDIQLQNVNAGTYSVAAFNLGGNLVANENVEVNNTTSTIRIHTAEWAPGMYQVVVRNGSAQKTIAVVKQ